MKEITKTPSTNKQCHDGSNSNDEFNATIQGNPIPIASSTELQNKSSKRYMRNSSMSWKIDSVGLYTGLDSWDDSTLAAVDSANKNMISKGIDPFYLRRTTPSPLRRFTGFDSSIESLYEQTLQSDQSSVDDAQLSPFHEEYLHRCTNEISRMTMIDASVTEPTLQQKTTILRGASCGLDDKENEWSMLPDFDNKLIESLLERESDPWNTQHNLDITRLAYEYCSKTHTQKPTTNSNKDRDVPHLSQLQSPRNLAVYDNNTKSSVQLLSNKTCLIWIGVKVRDNNIKSFTVNLNAPTAMWATISIVQSAKVFHITNQAGNEHRQSVAIQLDPRIDRKIYVSFEPADSSYQSGVIVLLLNQHKFKVRLFGYAESAQIELIGFRTVPHPLHCNKQLLVQHGRPPKSSYEADVSSSGGSVSIDVFNNGARTAFVMFTSHQTNVSFEPRAVLVIPKATIEVRVTSGVSMSSSISFMVFYVDEELRRACRQGRSEFPIDGKYEFLDALQLLTWLPNETLITLKKISNFDWRPYLRNQINASYREAVIMLALVPSRSEAVDSDSISDSALTIRCGADPSATACSSFSNIENLQTKEQKCMISTGKHLDSLSSILTGVQVVKDFIKFPVTRVGRASYQAILIRNYNLFPVLFMISDPIRTSPYNLRKSIETLTSTTTDSSSGLLSQCSENTVDSQFLTSGQEFSNSALTMKVAFEGKMHTVQPGKSLLIPTTFLPVAYGPIQCKCTVKFQHDESNRPCEKQIDLYGETIHRTNTELVSSSIPQPSENIDYSIPGIAVNPNLIEFGEISDDRRVARTLILKSRKPHSQQIFISSLFPPFEFRGNSEGMITVDSEFSVLKIYFNPTQTSARLNEAVLLLSDEEGNCTHVLLRGRFK